VPQSRIGPALSSRRTGAGEIDITPGVSLRFLSTIWYHEYFSIGLPVHLPEPENWLNACQWPTAIETMSNKT